MVVSTIRNSHRRRVCASPVPALAGHWLQRLFLSGPSGSCPGWVVSCACGNERSSTARRTLSRMRYMRAVSSRSRRTCLNAFVAQEPTHELVRLEAAAIALHTFVRTCAPMYNEWPNVFAQVVKWLSCCMTAVQGGWMSTPTKPRGQMTLIRLKVKLRSSMASRSSLSSCAGHNHGSFCVAPDQRVQVSSDESHPHGGQSPDPRSLPADEHDQRRQVAMGLCRDLTTAMFIQSC